ncbi:hypothetical protein M9458_055942, partial [Cirrhinus mrigala]
CFVRVEEPTVSLSRHRACPVGPTGPNIQSCGSRPQRARRFHSTLEFIFMIRLSQSVVLLEPKKMS